MKKIFYLIALACFCLPSYLAAQSDEYAILKTVNDFLEGGTNGEVDRFKNAFVPSAVQRSIGKTGVSGITVAELAAKIPPNQKMDRTTKIVSWSYAGTAATATTETQYASSKVIDYLNLLKVGNDWKIISRVFSRIDLDDQVRSSSGTTVTNATIINTKEKPAPAPAKKKKVENTSDDGW